MEEIEQERHRELLSITICCTIELYKKRNKENWTFLLLFLLSEGSSPSMNC
jgi:hypothetical protein